MTTISSKALDKAQDDSEPFELMQIPPADFNLFTSTPVTTGIIKARKIVHQNKDWHSSVHIWIVDVKKNVILLQKRSPKKDTFPNRYDISAAGHIPAHAEAIPTAQDELEEELGITIHKDELKFQFICPAEQAHWGGCNCYEHVYFMDRDSETLELALGKEEVTGVKWMSVMDLKYALESFDDMYVPRVEIYREAFFDRLDQFCSQTEIKMKEELSTSIENVSNRSITAIAWTGGKDCNLALLYAKRNIELEVKYLVIFRPEGKPFRAHPIPFIGAQAKSLQLKLLYVNIPENTTDYMKAYVDGIRQIKDDYGIKVICTGDMDLIGTMERNWIERCCEQVGDGMKVYLPLWMKDREECLNEMLEESFEIIFSCVKSPFFDGTWINRTLDVIALGEMKEMIDMGLTEDQIQRGIKPLDLCGERGEYHTMCVDGPLYQHRVNVAVNDEPVREDINNGTNWKGNIHNADIIWMISLKQ